MSKTSENLILELKADYLQDIEIIEDTQIAIHIEVDIFLDVIKFLYLMHWFRKFNSFIMSYLLSHEKD